MLKPQALDLTPNCQLKPQQQNPNAVKPDFNSACGSTSSTTIGSELENGGFPLFMRSYTAVAKTLL